MPKILTADPVAERYVAYVIEAPEIASGAAPGQLVMVRLPHGHQATPHSIADLDPHKGTLTIVVRHRAGSGGVQPPAAGDVEIDGPIGRAASVQRVSKALFVAEGLGVAAMLPRLRRYKESDCYTVVIAGHPSKDFVYWNDRLDACSDELYTATEDGSFGIRGTLRQTVRAVCQTASDIERAFIIGSLAGMKACTSVTTNIGIPTFISLGAVMEDQQVREADGEAPAAATFDWSQATDLDGRNVDFDGLVELLDTATTK